MKRTILFFTIILVAVLSVNTVNAQIGIRAGVGFSDITYTNGDVNLDAKSTLGLTLGVSKEIRVIGNFIKLVPEIMFDTKGTSNYNDPNNQFTIEGVAYNYAGFGLGLKMKIPLLPLYAIAQPYYQYLYRAQEIITDANGETTKTDLPDAYFENVNRGEYGVNLGGGLKIKMGAVAAIIEAKYTVPMSSLEDAKQIDNYTTDIENRYFTVSFGLLFGREKKKEAPAE